MDPRIDKNVLNLLQDVVKNAVDSGADAADAVLSDATSVSVARRLGKMESLSRSEEAEIGLRVFVGRKQAVVSSSDRDPDTLREMTERAIAMARNVPEDKYAGIADPSQLTHTFPALDLYDETELSVDRMNDLADATESAAMAVKGITNSDGAECSYGKDCVYYCASNGFASGYASSGYSLSVAVIAGEGTAMETDYDYDSSAFFEDLRQAKDIGQEAGRRAVQALNPRKGKTKTLPVIFDRRVSSGVIGSLASAISGGSVARGTTLLKNAMDEMIFPEHITIVDDPFLPRGHRSHPFDGEGIAPQKRNIIDKGRLTGWILDLATARQLGLETTGNAARGASSPPSPRVSNFYMQAGTVSPEELIADIEEGFLVTQMMGSGGNIVTGDYSRGARGFWIEKGKITYPVSEMTIAGNLRDMWRSIRPANDLILTNGIDAPTLLVGHMTVAGE